MDDLCTACLCTGRKLFYINETGFYHIYSQILSEIPVYDLSEICVRVCWECCAALRRFQKYKEQVKHCYNELLQFIHLGSQNAKNIEKVPHLQTHQVISIDYPEYHQIKTEYDTLDVSYDGQNNQEFIQNGQLLDQYNGQHLGEDFAQPLSQAYEQQIQSEATEIDNFVKEEEHNDLETFANDLEVKKKTERRKKSKNVDKVKIKKEKKKKITKRTVKVKTKVKKKKRKSLEIEIKTDESCHDFDDNSLSPFEDKDGIETDNVADEKFEVDSKLCDIYQKNELGVGIEDPEVVHTENVALTKVPRQPKEKMSPSEKPQCAECGKVFSSRKTLRYHLNVLHNGNNRYPCPRCGKIYQWKSNLGRHMRSHKARDSGELYCELCDKRFASVATYRQHLSISKRHVSESEFSYTCNECGKKFVNKVRLRDHIDWEHLQKIKFRCQLCNKPFKCHTSLYVHMKNVHRDKGLKDNLCDVCGKTFQNAAKLRYHIVAMHTTQTPYQCEQCTAAFGWYSSLYRHVREVHYKMKVHPSKAKKAKKRSDTHPQMMPPPHMVMSSQIPPPAMP